MTFNEDTPVTMDNIMDAIGYMDLTEYYNFMRLGGLDRLDLVRDILNKRESLLKSISLN